MEKKPFILGLDLGKASVGWAVVDCEEAPDGLLDGSPDGGLVPVGVRRLGSRVFQEMVEAKTRVPKNAERRQARGMRRNYAQRRRRRAGLTALLQRHDLLPAGKFTAAVANGIDRAFAEGVLGKKFCEAWPLEEKFVASAFAMRAMGLREDVDLERYEFGRVLLHIQRRRGYFSNRGAKFIKLDRALGVAGEAGGDGDGEEEVDADTGKVLEGVARLAGEMLPEETVGQYVWRRAEEGGGPATRVTKHFVEIVKKNKGQKVGFFATREMAAEELAAFWEKYAARLGLGEGLRRDVEFLVIEQTPLENSFVPKNKREADLLGMRQYTPRRKPGRAVCAFEPTRFRGAVAMPVCQEARTRMMINNIRFRGEFLSGEQREALYAHVGDPANLTRAGRLSWPKVAEFIGGGGVKKGDVNYEEGDTGGLVGNVTAVRICAALEETADVGFWRGLDDDDALKSREALVVDLLTIKDKLALYKRLMKHWGLSEGAHGGAYRLATVELEGGYGKHCLRVWRRILPGLREGRNYYEACREAGYLADAAVGGGEGVRLVGKVPNIANPIVQKALFEVRRVVNRVIAEYGAPAEIRVEMAREMGLSKKHRGEIEKEQFQNRKRNERAEGEMAAAAKAGKIPGFGYCSVRGGAAVRILPEDRKRYIMWKEEQGCRCPYCYREIGAAELFGGVAEVDHILPQAGFGQNYMNTVVACRDCNQNKKGRSPYGAWGGTDKWADICGRISVRRGGRDGQDKFPKLPLAKKQRIRDEKFAPTEAGEFVERDLKNTQYIAVATKRLLETCGNKVRVSKGRATSELRRWWGLNGVLPRRSDESVYVEQGGVLKYKAEAAAGVKDRGDHRHHAVDALVVALTDHKTLMRLVMLRQQRMASGDGAATVRDADFVLPGKMGSKGKGEFVSRVEKMLRGVVVSHACKDKVYGALHEESFYGAGVFYTVESIAGMKPSDLRAKVGALLALSGDSPDAMGRAAWLPNDGWRAFWEKWCAEYDGGKVWVHACTETGERVTEIRVANRCYVRRVPIGEAVKIVRQGQVVGKGRWVVDEGVRRVLKEWVDGGDAESDEGRLETAPPRMPAKKGVGPLIGRVRVARICNADAICLVQENKYAQLGSYSHVEIFVNFEGKKRGRFVSMMEAARRQAKGEPVVNVRPDGAGWKFWMSLRKDELVVWEAEVESDVHMGKPIYRVQYFDVSGRIKFRHHSVATASDGCGALLKRINQIKCRKVTVDELGRVVDAES